MNALAAVLRAVPLFEAAAPETLERLAQATRAASWDEGAELWAEGDTGGAILITAGLVEIAQRHAGGADATVALFGPYEIIGLTATLEGAPYPATAIAVTAEVHGLVLAAADLRAAVDRDHGLARATNRALIEHAHVLQAKIAILTAGTVEARLAALVLHLAARFGHEVGGAIHIPLTLTRRMLAQLVGARVETVIRVLGQWRRNKLVDATAEIVVRDPSALRRLIAAAP